MVPGAEHAIGGTVQHMQPGREDGALDCEINEVFTTTTFLRVWSRSTGPVHLPSKKGRRQERRKEATQVKCRIGTYQEISSRHGSSGDGNLGRNHRLPSAPEATTALYKLFFVTAIYPVHQMEAL
jgi:hypothetical protein